MWRPEQSMILNEIIVWLLADWNTFQSNERNVKHTHKHVHLHGPIHGIVVCVYDALILSL